MLWKIMYILGTARIVMIQGSEVHVLAILFDLLHVLNPSIEVYHSICYIIVLVSSLLPFLWQVLVCRQSGC